MASSAHSASLSRYPKWVLAATGFAAAYGTYLIWTSWPSTDPSTNLQRRNVVHRLRNHRDATVFRSSPSRRSSHPFGVLHIDHNGNIFRYPVGPEPPRAAELQDIFNVSETRAEEIANEAQEVALKCIIQVLSSPQSDDSLEQSDLASDLQPLVALLREKNVDDLLSNLHLLCSGRWKYDSVVVAKAFAEYCGFDRIPMNIDRMELGLTETTVDSDHEDDREPAQGIKGLLYNIAEEQAKRQAYVHRGTRCDSCGELPIRGIRWHCINCPDYDLCSTCEAQNVHPRTHVFTKIKIPIATLAQPHQVHDLWYPGDPQRHWPLLKVPLRKRLVIETGFEDVQIEALYDQFSCIANVALPDDPMEINAAIDRRAFNKAMMSPQWPRPLEPNFLFDRMFNFYDTDNNGVVDFGEFVSGLAYLRMSAKRASLDRVFRGYDVDGDGFVSRRDLIRMLSAKYAVQKYIVKDIIQAEEAELVRHTADVVRSSQPISAAFTQEDVPPGETRVPGMKSVDQFGENQVRVSGPFGQAVLPNGEEPPDSNFIGAVTARYGINPWPEHVVQDGMVTMEHAMNVRNRYTKSESVPIEDIESNEQRYLVETDSRRTRGRPDLESPEVRWKQDIEEAAQGSSSNGVNPAAFEDDEANTAAPVDEEDAWQSLGLPDHILERGRAYEVPAAEKDFGKEVLFQVVQEAINELLDPLFEPKETLAVQVRETREERRRYRKEIDDYVREKKTFQEELQSGAEIDPLLATAKSAYAENRSASDIDRTHRSGTASPSETGVENHRLEIRLRAGADGTILDGPNPSQYDIAQEIHQQIARENELLDESVLEDLETTIREQPLEDLLETAGYSVASPIQERHGPILQNEADARTSAEPPSTAAAEEEFTPSDTANDEAESDDDEVEGEPWDPTLPHHRPNTSSSPLRRTASSSTDDDEEMRMSPSSPPTPLPAQTPFPTPNMPFSTIPPLPPPHSVQPKVDEGPPSTRRLEELSILDAEERSILGRGGPGRLSCDELEDAIKRDREEGRGLLVGLVEGWLEWAGF